MHVPERDLAEEVRMSAVGEEAVSQKAFLESLRQLVQRASLQKTVLLSLEVPLLLIGHDFSGKQKQPQGKETIIIEIELSCVCLSDR